MDFIDLDEQDFSSFSSFPQQYPITPDLQLKSLKASSSLDSLSSESSISSTSTALFIRSASLDKEMIKLNTVEAPRIEGFEFSIFLPDSTATARLIFNYKGPHHEGRDSQVFRGTLYINESATVAVAVKVYRDDQIAQEGAQKEIEIAHLTTGRPDFLKFYYSGQLTFSDAVRFITVWEWIDGGTLDRSISKLTDDALYKTIFSIAQSLNHLHANHIAHHDLKPQNILITMDRVILIDFGDSKKLNSETSLLPIDEGIGLGTLAYTAPELLSKKSSDYSPFAADVYSFGVLLFYLLNHGKILPFASLIPHRAVQLILTVQKGFFAGGYNPESPAQSPFFPLMKQCLQVDPKLRPTFPQILRIINEKM